MFSAVDHESAALGLQADAEITLGPSTNPGARRIFSDTAASMFVQPRAQALGIQLDVGGQDVA
jgi:hypothetical protein